MGIKYQQYNEKHPYKSPTTPELYVTFRNYIIELVCLNVNSKLGSRFWSDKKYWGPKYKREIRGVSNLSKELDFNDAVIQTALIEIIIQYNIKALVAKKTITKVVNLTKKHIIDIKEKRERLAKKQLTPMTIDDRKNSIFVDMGMRNKLAKIKELENDK